MADGKSTIDAVQRQFLQNAAAIRGFIIGLLTDRDAANDVFQEVFLTVTSCAEQFRPDGNFLAWVRGVARNKVLEHVRKNSRIPQPFDDELLEMMVASAGRADAIWEDRRAALAECIQQLAPRARQIRRQRLCENLGMQTALTQDETCSIQFGWSCRD